MSGGLHDESAEHAVIAAALLRPEFTLSAVELRPEQFFDARCRLAWEGMHACVARGVPVDPVTIAHALGSRGAVLEMGWFSERIGEAVTADNVRHYAGIVSSYALKREVVTRLADALARARQVDATGPEALAAATEAITGIDTAGETDARTIREVIRLAALEAQRRGEAAANGDAAAFGIPTGYADLDNFMGGISEGSVTLVGGRPSMGKSALVRSFADHANELGCGVHVFTLEDQAPIYGLRMLADHSRVDLGVLRSMKGITKGQLEALHGAANRLMRRERWLVDDTAGLSSAQIAQRVRRHKRANQTRLVIVDYVQLMREPTARRGDKGDEVARAAENLVALARSERVAVILLSQLSRDCEKREDKRPMMSDLRETGVLEQVAESVLFVFRPQVYLDEEKHPDLWARWQGRGKVIVAKHKNSATGEVELAWDAPTATYRDLARREFGGGYQEDGYR